MKNLLKFICVLFLLLIINSPAFANEIYQTYTFSEPIITQKGDYDIISISDTWLKGKPGEPLLPQRGIEILLPPGEVVSDITIKGINPITLEGYYNIIPSIKQLPISTPAPAIYTPNSTIYNSDKPFPLTNHTIPQTQFYRGHSIALLRICPISYVPSTGTITYYREMEIKITTISENKAQNALNLLRTDEETINHLYNMIDNPAMITSYPIIENKNKTTDYDMLIITNEALEPAFAVLAEFRNKYGIRTQIATTEDIYASMSGIDDAEKIRNYILQEYNNNISYVLLGGDAGNSNGIGGIVPHRGMYVTTSTHGGSIDDADIPADMYYASLDGNWNTDGDSNWGEQPLEIDLYQEIAIGRITADNTTEAANHINKIIMYTESPVIADIKKAIMIGEELSTAPQTWGGDCKDEIKDGALINGLFTSGFPTSWGTGMETLYDRDGTWTPNTLFTKLNAGKNFVNHLGHSDTGYTMKFYNSNVNTTNFTNNGTDKGFYTMYTQGCYPGAFDNRNSYHTYGEDCIAEDLTALENGPCAMIANSRYGWYEPGGTGASSQLFDRTFFDAIWKEDIFTIGYANKDSKDDLISACDDDPWMYWAIFEINLLGDPSMEFWTDTPTNISASIPGAIYLGDTQITIENVSDGTKSLLENARVAITFEDGLKGIGYTDSNGDVTIIFDEAPTSLGIAYIRITAHNCFLYESETSIISSGEAYVAKSNYLIDDSNTPNNNDGELDAGETIILTLALTNYGDSNATNVNATISTDDTYTTIIDSMNNYGDIDTSSTSNGDGTYAFSVSSNCPNEYIISFNLNITSDQDIWNSTFNLIVSSKASITLNRTNLTVSLPPNDSTTQIVIIGNEGPSDLIYDVSYQNTSKGKASGGPDTYGYTWVDNDGANGPTYDWQSISATGASISLADDDLSSLIDLYFTFNFYGTDYNGIYISSNGILSFNYIDYGYFEGGVGIPHSDAPNNIICPFWDDLNPSAGGNIYYLLQADKFTIEWNNVPEYSASTPVNYYTFQTIIYPDGKIKFQYNSMDNLSDADIGMENSSGTVGLSIPTTSTNDGKAVLIRPPAYWLSVITESGTIQPNASENLIVNFNSTNLDTGTYTAEIYIDSNDPDGKGISTIDVTLYVTNELIPTITLDSDSLEIEIFEDSINDEEYFTIYNTGTAQLDFSISDLDKEGWLTFEPDSGFVNPGESVSINLTIDSYGYTVGTYTKNLLIETNDPEYPTKNLICKMIVLPPTSINLSSFTASITPQGIILDWDIISNEAILGFNIYKSNNFENKRKIINNNLITNNYRFLDRTYNSETTYYWLEMIEANGTKSIFEPISILANAHLPSDYHLKQNYPNPFNPKTDIAYELPKNSYVKLNIYNTSGQLVRNLIDEDINAGYHNITWDGIDNAGNMVSSGIYIYTLNADGYYANKKMILLK